MKVKVDYRDYHISVLRPRTSFLGVNMSTTSEALWEMEGQMLARRSSLGQRMQEEEQCTAN